MNERSLSYNLILYPNEDNSHYNALEKIKNSDYDYAYIVHNQDRNKKNELKKEHTHVTIRFRNSRYKNAVALELGITPNYMQKCNSLENSLKYLIHFNDPEKYQYSIDEVYGTLKQKLIQILDNIDIPESEKLLSIMNYINSYRAYLTLTDLLRYLCTTPLLPVYKKYSYSIKTVLDEHNIYYSTYRKSE